MKAKKPLTAKTRLTANKPIKKVADKPKTKPKFKTIGQLKKEADKWHSLATRYRFAEMKDGEWVAQCITCKVEKPIKQLQCGHFISRAHNILRYEEMNTGPQCYGCNVMQQGRQFQFSIEIDLLYGPGSAKSLLETSKQSHQFKREELLEIIADRKEQVKFYERQQNG